MKGDILGGRLNWLTARPDIAIAIILVLAMAMMILPLPTIIVDAFIALNLATAMMLVMTAIYLRRPTDFSSLPVVIVITTVFRLAVEITTTRLILAEGEAGEIVQTFGDFVLGGNIAVGIIIFLIITVVQFLVVSKGAERVAEVAARFTLDSLPGRQLAVDSDLRNGDIDKDEAKKRRADLAEESQLFGAMDGAMKFVKGDVIAGLIIVFINLGAGIAIGTTQKGLAFGEAARVYSLLSIGEALISQIPSLLLAISAATIVTRVKGDAERDLGGDVFGQLAGDGRALQMTAIVMLAMAAIPGFPSVVLVLLAALFGGGSYVMSKKKTADEAQKTASAAPVAGQPPAQQAGGAAPAAAAPAPAKAAPRPRTPMAVLFNPALAEVLDLNTVEAALESIREKVSDDLGIVCPKVSLRVEPKVAENHISIEHEEVPVLQQEYKTGFLLLNDDVSNLDLAKIPYKRVDEGTAGESVWIEQDYEPALLRAQIGYHNAETHACKMLEQVLRRRASSFIGIQETRQLFQRFETQYKELVDEVWRIVPVARIADVFRRLLDDDISLRHIRLILEGLAEWGERESSAAMLAEYIRPNLKRQICYRYANAARVLSIYLIDRYGEELMRQSISQTAVGEFLALPDTSAEELIKQVRALLDKSNAAFVIVCSIDLRRYLRVMLVKNGLDVPVLSYEDLSEEFIIQPSGAITLTQREDPSEERDWAA